MDIWALGISSYISDTGDLTVLRYDESMKPCEYDTIQRNLQIKIRLNEVVVSVSLTKTIPQRLYGT